MNIRVCRYSSVPASYGRVGGAEFITEPKDKCGETLCYMRDPDGYVIEVGR